MGGVRRLHYVGTLRVESIICYISFWNNWVIDKIKPLKWLIF